MPYLFAVESRSHQDLASGGVLRSRPGQVAFPVRPARELIGQALALAPGPAARPRVIYDPCCGAGHLLTTLGLLHPTQLTTVVGSDVDETALQLAGENLALLGAGGLTARAAALAALVVAHDRPAHHQALASARTLAAERGQAVAAVRVFRADALDPAQLRAGLGALQPEIVVADVPYGRGSSWRGAGGAALSDDLALPGLLAALGTLLEPGAVVALATSRPIKVTHPAFRRARRLLIGPRRLTWLVRS